MTVLWRCRSTTMPCKTRRPTLRTHSGSGRNDGSAPPALMLQVLPLHATVGEASLTMSTPWRGHSYPTARAHAAALASHWPSWRCGPVAHLPLLMHIRLCSPMHAEVSCERWGQSVGLELQTTGFMRVISRVCAAQSYCWVASLSSVFHADSHRTGDGAGSLQGVLG